MEKNLNKSNEIDLLERTTKNIQIQLNKIAESDTRITLNQAYYETIGFINGIWFAKLIDDDSKEHYSKLADDAFDKRERELFPDEYSTRALQHIVIPPKKRDYR